MNIILVSDRLSGTRTITLGPIHLAGIFVALFFAFLILSSGLNYLTLRYAAVLDHPVLNAILLSEQRQQAAMTQRYVQEHIGDLATRVGELQAQLMRLDGLGEKLAKVAGLKPQEMPTSLPPGRGGAVSSQPSRQLSMEEVSAQLVELSHQIDIRHDQLGVLEALLVNDSARRKFLPTLMPVEVGYYSSNFGYRNDPFTGHSSFHEGVDFTAETGTPILAAASGKVITAETHPQYGKMVEIDHGNGLVSRYAHGSKLLVAVDDVVVRGQKIAEVGSTGRSTGSHLHFEVRLNGVPQNPARFLQASN